MNKVIILCGGKGRRLGELSAKLPKALIPLKGRPILQHILEFYINCGFRKFILCTGYLSEAIEAFVLNNHFDAEIEICNAGEDVSMLKRLLLVKHLINESAIVNYGDTFVNIDPNLVIKEHKRSKKDATVTIADIRSPFGIVRYDKNRRVTFFKEKPSFEYYIGQFIIEGKALRNIDNKLLSLPDGEGLIRLFKNLIKEKKLNAYKHEGFNITFNTTQELKKAEEDFIKFFTQQEG